MKRECINCSKPQFLSYHEIKCDENSIPFLEIKTFFDFILWNEFAKKCKYYKEIVDGQHCSN